MTLSSCTLGRYVRLALLLLLLASQGIANAHEQGYSHTSDSHLCSICLIGHGLGAAVGVHPDVPQVQISQAPIPTYSIADLQVSRVSYYFTRAPPISLRSTQ